MRVGGWEVNMYVYVGEWVGRGVLVSVCGWEGACWCMSGRGRRW